MPRIALAVLVASALACARSSAPASAGTGPGTTDPGQKNLGKISIGASATALSATGGTALEVCGTFTLQPYSLDTEGNQTLAGQPLVVTSSASAGTDLIAGCIDGPTDADNDNWGYLVTATNFNNCADGGTIDGLSPTTVTSNYPMDCQAGIDVPLDIDVDVSVSENNHAGYVDVSVGVDSTVVQVGCKEAEIASDGLEHFGESFIDPTGASHLGLVALTLSPTPTQWDGTVGANPGSDTYYTGTVDPATTYDILQTFLESCGAGEEYGDAQHAQCDSQQQYDDDNDLIVVTTASLADAFLAVPGQGFVSVTVNNGFPNLYTSSISSTSSVPAMMDATLAPAGLGFNTQMNEPYVQGALYNITGVYVDQSTPNQLLLSATDPNGVPGYFTFPAPFTTVGSFEHLPDAATIQCLGLFTSPHGCFKLNTCTLPTRYCGGSGTSSDPYQICSAAAFEEMGWSTDAISANSLYFAQTADIAMDPSFVPFEFHQSYDGQGHQISYAYNGGAIAGPYAGAYYAGLFSKLNDGASVANLSINANVQGINYVGGLAGVNDDGTITLSNISVSGSVSGWNVGGILGQNFGPETAPWSKLSSSAAIVMNATCGNAQYGAAGGIIGVAGGVMTINEVDFSGSISATGGTIGGISGYAQTLTLTEALQTGSVPDLSQVACNGQYTAIGVLNGSEDGADDNLDTGSIWASDAAGLCTISGCATSGYTGDSSAGASSAALDDAVNYAANYPAGWDFTAVWSPPTGTSPAALQP